MGILEHNYCVTTMYLSGVEQAELTPPPPPNPPPYYLLVGDPVRKKFYKVQSI